MVVVTAVAVGGGVETGGDRGLAEGAFPDAGKVGRRGVGVAGSTSEGQYGQGLEHTDRTSRCLTGGHHSRRTTPSLNQLVVILKV
ncbi:hypothetical protein D3C84_1036550 [compost metagenome]